MSARVALPLALFLILPAGGSSSLAAQQPPTRPAPIMALPDDFVLPGEFVDFTCPMHPQISHDHEDGVCPICSMGLVDRRLIDGHADHTPKRGGIFFMAPDNWHHLEGVYAREGVFRVFLYDNFTNQMNTRGYRGRAVLREVYDERTDTFREVLVYPLVASAGGEYLEARIVAEEFPVEVTAKITFGLGGREERFDFVFADYTVEPEPGALPVDVEDPELLLFAGIENPIPDEPALIAVEIDARDSRIGALVQRGGFTEIWVPALEAKALALALDERLERLPQERRLIVRLAVKQLVRAAWLLDWSGDAGNRLRVEEAYAMFAAAASEIRAAFDLQHP